MRRDHAYPRCLYAMASEVLDYDDEVDLQKEDLTLGYFNGLMRKDRSERETFMDAMTKSLLLWVKRRQDPSAEKLLESHLPAILSLSVNSPYEDIRKRLTDLLAKVKVSDIHGAIVGSVEIKRPILLEGGGASCANQRV